MATPLGGQGVACPLDSEKFAKIGKKRKKIRKRGKNWEKEENREGFFFFFFFFLTLSLTYRPRARYAIDIVYFYHNYI